jgi:hypothetical protein
MHGIDVGGEPAGNGGTQSVRRSRRRGRVVVGSLAAALLACTGSLPPPGGSDRVERSIEAGLSLYASGEFVVAAQRFQEASESAHALRLRDLEKRAAIAECTSWLRARAIREFDACTRKLERMHRRANRAEPGIGTLLALGAIAGDRPSPPFRVASDVAPIIRAAGEGRGE